MNIPYIINNGRFEPSVGNGCFCERRCL